MLWCGQQIVAAPTSGEPITLAEAKGHCRVDADDEDAYLADLISVARETVEGITGRMLQQQTWRAFYPAWGDFVLPKPPVSTLTHIKYYPASGGSAVTVAGSSYQLLSASEPMSIVLAYGKDWPTEEMRTGDPIEIQFVCGYSAVPRRLRQAMKMLIAHWHSKREAVVIGNPTAIDSKELALAVTHLCGDYVARFPV